MGFFRESLRGSKNPGGERAGVKVARPVFDDSSTLLLLFGLPVPHRCRIPWGSPGVPSWSHSGSILVPFWSLPDPLEVPWGLILVLFWLHFGPILVPSLVSIWVQFGSILVPSVIPSLVPILFQFGPSLAPDWSQFGPRLVPAWS